MKQNKPIIGILPTYNLTNEANDPYLDKASFVSMYSDKIIEAGGLPIGLVDKDILEYKDICDGYLWAGGNKIHRELYTALQDCITNHKPFLGICLGAQALSTFFNILEDKEKEPNLSFEEIYQKNKEINPYLTNLEDPSLHLHYVTRDEESINNAKHLININKESFLYDIYKEDKIEVVSLHSIVINRLPKNLRVSAKSIDDIIEAIEYHQDNNKMIGVQYHPEILNDTKIFSWLIQNTRREYLLLVNKNHEMPKNNPFTIIEYKPVEPINNPNMELKTYYAWKELQKCALKNGFNIEIESAHRSREKQERVMEEITAEQGLEYAKKYVAKPGYSEHETGLAIDIWMNHDGIWINEFDSNLDEFYKWLSKNCAKFGFILRYPKGKENITGYSYEPWHLRFVGNSIVATYIMKNNLTLEEYLERSEKNA